MFRVKYLPAIILVVLICPAMVFGLSIDPPSSYVKPTPNGKYIFVMLTTQSTENEARRFSEAKANEIRTLRSAYAKSGLYRNDGSKPPLWTVDWYKRRVEPLSDGIHLVRLSFGLEAPDSEAVAFFSRGVLLRSYLISELVSAPELMWNSSPPYLWKSSERLHDAARQYEIRTRHSECYLFDITTGDIVYAFRPPRMIVDILHKPRTSSSMRATANYGRAFWLICAGLSLLFLLAGGLCVWGWRKRKCVGPET
jgi:hypothetical protein